MINAEQRKRLIEQLRKTPIVQIGCEKAGISRATYYRWRKESKQFRKETDEAITEGEFLINDLSESQLITLIKEKNFHAISLWLRQHHQKYANRLEISGSIEHASDELSAKQKSVIKQALRLSLLNKQNYYGQKTKRLPKR